MGKKGEKQARKQAMRFKFVKDSEVVKTLEKSVSLAQNANMLVRLLKNKSNFDLPKGNYSLTLERTNLKLPAGKSVEGYGVKEHDTLIIQESDPELVGAHRNVSHDVPEKPVKIDFEDFMMHSNKIRDRLLTPAKLFKIYVLISKALPPGQVTVALLYKVMRWVGTLVNTPEEKRKREHIKANRCTDESHELLVFHEIDEDSRDLRFDKAVEEMYAHELAFEYVWLETDFAAGWGAGLEVNYDVETIKTMDFDNNQIFVRTVLIKCLSKVCNYYGLQYTVSQIEHNGLHLPTIEVLPAPTVMIFPKACTVPAAGGTSTHQINNNGNTRLAFKVKSSNISEYCVKPVFGFVEANASATLEVIRLNGPSKEDKLVIQYAEVPSEETDPQTSFKVGPPSGEVTLPLKAE